ncbi:MAG: transporter substrate-binding domain-containing protein [Cypionkella sp.]
MAALRQLFGAALCLWLSGSIVAAQGAGLVVAFRQDAAPFSSGSAPDGPFTGLFVSFCEEAVKRAGYSIAKRVAITAAGRFGEAVAGFDLICDPTTVTQSRARLMDFTPILFIANSSFLARPEVHVLTEAEIGGLPDCAQIHATDPARQLVGVGMVGDTTANATYQLARDQGRLTDTADYALCPVSFRDHHAGVLAICNGPLSYYFGDIDILRAEVARKAGCDLRPTADFRAYEPYALQLPSHDTEFRRKFIAALYGLFADGTALKMYQAAFGAAPMSGPLDMLFRINNIPLGQN